MSELNFVFDDRYTGAYCDFCRKDKEETGGSIFVSSCGDYHICGECTEHAYFELGGPKPVSYVCAKQPGLCAKKQREKMSKQHKCVACFSKLEKDEDAYNTVLEEPVCEACQNDICEFVKSRPKRVIAHE